jgi:formylglycine-generating enzyme required for sulfatase activity
MYLVAHSAGGAGMADIFISYSKKHAALTEALARDLEAEGYTTWWDTGLLPGDEFPDEIKRQLDAAKAVIVIWTESSVNSKWVRAEATRAHAQGKLIALHRAGLDLQDIPLPLNTLHSELASERAKIFAALSRRDIAPSNKKLEPVTRSAPLPVAPSAAKAAEDKGGLFSRWLGSQARPTKAGGVRVIAGAGGGTRELGAKPGESFRDFGAGPEMVVIPAGSFMMGSKDGEGDKSERPQHKVTIPQAFAAGKYPVTFDEWDAAVAAGGVSHKPSDAGWGRGRQPAINVSWDDAQAYVKWLSAKTGQPYRLLSEAEWEYACRAGSSTAYCFGDSEGELDRYAWYSANSGRQTHPVGEKTANDFGVHDMHGNVWEWCEDVWHDSYDGKPEGLKASGGAWITGDSSRLILRGGSWGSVPGYLRAACRNGILEFRLNDAGLRVARTLNP